MFYLTWSCSDPLRDEHHELEVIDQVKGQIKGYAWKL